MNDTACTNAYHMPVSEITAIDANEITQIVALAILQSASIPCIGDFLRWFRVQLDAFMIDRSDAEIGAIEAMKFGAFMIDLLVGFEFNSTPVLL
jgi:hypothetical protein